MSEIDVSKCKYYSEVDCCCHDFGQTITAIPCGYIKDCYYKQLQRLKAENEELKENYRLSCLKCKFKNAFMVLDEIEEIILKRQKEHYCYCDECSPFKEILQLIKQAKEGE